MDTVIVFVAILFEVISHPLKCVRELRDLGKSLLFGDNHTQHSTFLGFEEFEPAALVTRAHLLTKYYHLHRSWGEADYKQRQHLMPEMQDLLEQMKLHNDSLPPYSFARIKRGDLKMGEDVSI